MSNTIDLSALSADQLAALKAMLTSATTTPAPTKATPVKASPLQGKSLTEIQAALDADASIRPLVVAELTARINRPNAKDGAIKRAQGALDRLAIGGPVVSPKGEKASAFEKTPEEKLAERTTKLADHRAKLAIEQGEVISLRGVLVQTPEVAKAAVTQLIAQAERRVKNRLEWIASQEAGIRALGFSVPGATPAKRTRSRKVAA